MRPLANLGLRLFSRITNTNRARVLVHRDNEILLVRDIFSGERWSMPGGGVGRKERPDHAASREVLEEVGYEIDPGDLVRLGEINRNSGSEQYYTEVLYSYKAQGEVKVKIRKWEIVEARWFDTDILPELHATSVQEALRLLRQP